MTTTVASRESVAPQNDAQAGATDRTDIHGIRALAILLVVSWALDLPRLAGGFVGVDVFFVVSGFLLSRELLWEMDRNRRVDVARFWARRARRLFPAVGLVVAVTMVAGYLVAPIYLLPSLAADGLFSALLGANHWFEMESRPPLDAAMGASLFEHMWAVAVLAQFSLVAPLYFWLASALRRVKFARRVSDFRRKMVLGLFVVFGLASLGATIWLGIADDPFAFYALGTRLWEFSLGGLLAASVMPDWIRKVVGRTLLGVVGLLGLAASVLFIESSRAYPSYWALLPVMATLLLLAGGEDVGGKARPTAITQVLSLPPVQLLGRVAGAWYLWHWPVMLLAIQVLGTDGTVVRAVACLAAVVPAWATYQFVERPIRSLPVLSRNAALGFGAGVGALALGALAAVGVGALTPASATVPDAAIHAYDPPADADLEQRLASVAEHFASRAAAPCPGGKLKTKEGDEYCVDGDIEAKASLLLLGDSRATQWRRPLAAIAKRRGIKLIVRSHDVCPPIAVPFGNEKGPIEVCTQQLEGDQRVLKAIKPRSVIVAAGAGRRESLVADDGTPLAIQDQSKAWATGSGALYAQILATGASLGVIHDEPALAFLPGRCITNAKAVGPCEPERAKVVAQSKPLLDAERRSIASISTPIPSLEATDLVCDRTVCHLEIDGVLTYADTFQLADAFLMRQIPRLERFVSQVDGD